MSEYYCAGVVKVDTGELKYLIAVGEHDGGTSIYYNNDPFGIVGCHGFGDLTLKPVDISTDTALIEQMKAMIKGDMYGTVEAVVSFKEGLVLVRDTAFFTGDFLDKATKDVAPLSDDFIEISDGESDLSEDDLQIVADF